MKRILLLAWMDWVRAATARASDRLINLTEAMVYYRLRKNDKLDFALILPGSVEHRPCASLSYYGEASQLFV